MRSRLLGGPGSRHSSAYRSLFRCRSVQPVLFSSGAASAPVGRLRRAIKSLPQRNPYSYLCRPCHLFPESDAVARGLEHKHSPGRARLHLVNVTHARRQYRIFVVSRLALPSELCPAQGRSGEAKGCSIARLHRVLRRTRIACVQRQGLSRCSLRRQSYPSFHPPALASTVLSTFALGSDGQGSQVPFVPDCAAASQKSSWPADQGSRHVAAILFASRSYFGYP